MANKFANIGKALAQVPDDTQTNPAPVDVLAVMGVAAPHYPPLHEARAAVAEVYAQRDALVKAAERAVKWMDAVVRQDAHGSKTNGIRSWREEMRHVQGKQSRPEWLYKPTMTAAQARRQLALERGNAQAMLQQEIDRAALARVGGAK